MNSGFENLLIVVLPLLSCLIIMAVVWRNMGRVGMPRLLKADPLNEADVYLAYGRRMQAIELLENALRIDPSRKELARRLHELRAG